jgi:hypothetical protein
LEFLNQAESVTEKQDMLLIEIQEMLAAMKEHNVGWVNGLEMVTVVWE